MDKNTITGLVLIGLLFLGFMWLSPEPEQTQSSNDITTQTETTATAMGVDSLSASELGWLKENIRTAGAVAVKDSAVNYNLKGAGYDLTLSGEAISGTLTLDSKDVVNYDDVMAKDLTKMTAVQQRKAIDMLRNTINTLGKYGKFAQFLSGDEQTVTLENDVLALQLNSKSGSISRAELKQYESEYNADETVSDKHKVVLFENGSNNLNFVINTPQALNTGDFYFRPQQLNDSTVLMTLDLSKDAYWGIKYTLPKGENYVVKVDIVQHNIGKEVLSNSPILGIDWRQDVRRQEKGQMFEERNSALYYKFAGGDVENLSEMEDEKEEKVAKLEWIGYKNQFFSSVLIPTKTINTADFESTIIPRGTDYLKNLSTVAEFNDYDWQSENPVSFDYYLGPNLYPLLSDLEDTLRPEQDLELTELIPLGWTFFRWINTIIIIPVFDFLGGFGLNYGIVILLLTIFIKLVIFPFTFKSYKSQAKMRVLAPDIKAINDKYPGNENAMLRQQKTMELYSKAGASPFSGCLPMLFQMPILFAMFTFFPSCIELRGESFLWAHDLSAPDAIISWSGNIPLITEYFGNHISLFCLLMTATNIIYTYITMQSQGGAQMPGMKWMMYLMPVMFMVFFNNYASGLSYYYFVSLLITILQTYAFRKVIKEDAVRREMAENAKKPRKKSGFMARLEEAQRQQQAMLREQQKRNHNGKGRQ